MNLWFEPADHIVHQHMDRIANSCSHPEIVTEAIPNTNAGDALVSGWFFRRMGKPMVFVGIFFRPINEGVAVIGKIITVPGVEVIAHGIAALDRKPDIIRATITISDWLYGQRHIVGSVLNCECTE